MERIVSLDFLGAREWFNPTMQERLSRETLESTWRTCVSNFGAFKNYSFNGVTRVRGYDALEYDLVFESRHATARVVFDDSGSIAGLFIR